MGQCASPTHPERILMQGLGQLGDVAGIAADQVRRQQPHGLGCEEAVREHRSVTGYAALRMDSDDTMNRVLGLYLGIPSALRAFAH